MVNVPHRLEFPCMSYPTKTYKVHPFYKVLFDSVFDVLSNQKSPFLEWIMDRHLGTDAKESLSQYSYNELFIDMIRRLETRLREVTLEDLSFELKTKGRFIELMGAYRDNPYLPTTLTIFTVRISNEEVQRVSQIKNGYLLKEVVQIAFINYLSELDDDVYTLVKQTFLKAIEPKN